MKSLHGKFFLLISALVLIMGSTAFLLQWRSIRAYSLAMTQAINEHLAQQIAAIYLPGLHLPVDPIPSTVASIKSKLAPLMVINPGIELYVLDHNGRLIAYTLPSSEIRRQQISIQPINDFLGHRFMFPLLGDNPRDVSTPSTFSVAPLDSTSPTGGYLYIILGGAQSDAAAHRLQSKLLFRGTFTIAAVGIAIALAAGFFVLITMTRRLRLLVNAIEVFRSSQFRSLAAVSVGEKNAGDELDRLGHAYNAMVAHIQNQMATIAQSDALRRDLIASVSHDLRTPLASLRGYLETLQLKEDALSPSKRREYLQIVASQGERLHRLVEELFELAKLQDLAIRINWEPFSLSELVQDIVQKFSLCAKEKGLELHATFLPNAPLMTGDISLIERLLDNLLENAIRHTTKGRIDVTVSTDAYTITLQVADTGIGIAEDVLPHIFERFYVDKTRGPSAGGTGLGLAIVSRIVELHNGQVFVHSQLGMGTTFEIRWPAKNPSGN